MHVAVALPEDTKDLEEVGQRLALFLLPGKLRGVAAAFDEALIPHVDGLEQDRPVGRPQIAAHGHGKHAALGRQKAPGAAAGSFDEILDGGSVGQNAREIFVEYG